MANTFELISSYTASTTVSSISFSSIPSTYTDLVLVLSTRTNAGGAVYNQTRLRFNGSSTNYTNRNLLGSGTAASSGTWTTSMYVSAGEGSTSTANTFDNVSIYIPNYAGSQYKSISVDAVQENNATEAYALLDAGLWSDTSAINAISVFPDTVSFVANSTAYLYGVKNA